MNILIKFIAFYWDNHQGGCGEYVTRSLLVTVPPFVESKDLWSNIHIAVKENLKTTRPFDQSAYSKEQGEYTILSAELLK